MIDDVDSLVDKAIEKLEGEVTFDELIGAMGIDPDKLNEADIAQIQISLYRYRDDVYKPSV